MENHEIDRQKLGSIIFHNAEKRQLLNGIVHPEVRKRMGDQVDAARGRCEQVIVLDIPLLFESKLTHMVEKTILVYVDRGVQLQRLMERNDLAWEEAEARVNSQMPLVEKVALADAVIDNNGSVEDSREQLSEILRGWGITTK
jgi:dephospho-CoA kinase